MKYHVIVYHKEHVTFIVGFNHKDAMQKFVNELCVDGFKPAGDTCVNSSSLNKTYAVIYGERIV